jgi:hypothetical protein
MLCTVRIEFLYTLSVDTTIHKALQMCLGRISHHERLDMYFFYFHFFFLVVWLGYPENIYNFGIHHYVS